MAVKRGHMVPQAPRVRGEGGVDFTLTGRKGSVPSVSKDHRPDRSTDDQSRVHSHPDGSSFSSYPVLDPSHPSRPSPNLSSSARPCYSISALQRSLRPASPTGQCCQDRTQISYQHAESVPSSAPGLAWRGLGQRQSPGWSPAASSPAGLLLFSLGAALKRVGSWLCGATVPQRDSPLL